MKAEDIKKIMGEVDCLSFRSSVILKLITPYYMTIAKTTDFAIMPKVIWVDEEYIVIAVKKREKLDDLEQFLNNAAPYISDILML
jgi:hypothetical protein